jgi:hypothetical protein
MEREHYLAYVQREFCRHLDDFIFPGDVEQQNLKEICDAAVAAFYQMQGRPARYSMEERASIETFGLEFYSEAMGLDED